MVGANSTIGVRRSATAALATHTGIGALNPGKVLNRSGHRRERNIWFCRLSSHRFRQKLLVIERWLQLALFEFALRNLRQIAYVAVKCYRRNFLNGHRRRGNIRLL